MSTTPTWGDIALRCTEIAEERNHYAGYPTPIQELFLVIEPRHPLYDKLNGFRLCDKADPEPVEDLEIVNTWRRRGTGERVFVWRENGSTRSRISVLPGTASNRRFDLTLNTLAPADVWRLDAEATAAEMLEEMIGERRAHQYLMTGMFLETSRRSGITYVFRRLRPTIALGRMFAGVDSLIPIAALCMHPIGYYHDSFAGSMVPTDEVVAHLTMMRGDEHGYWKRCNQHDPNSAEAGI